MFWYIGALLMGFSIGYLVAISKPKKTGYRRGKRDCRNCKHLVKIDFAGWVTCRKVGHEMASKPKYCSQYEKVDDDAFYRKETQND